MPYSIQWTDAEEYLTYGNVTVYCLYKDDEVEQGRLEYWYALNDAASESEGPDEGVFDIREYGNPNHHDLDTDNGRAARMHELIDRGVLGDNGIVHEELAEVEEDKV